MTATRPRRTFRPALDSLPLRLSPTNICPMIPTVDPPDLPPDPVIISPMQPTLVTSTCDGTTTTTTVS